MTTYTPRPFALDDRQSKLALITAWNFGVLLSVDGDGRLLISHLTFLVDEEANRLVAHVARANPHWRRIEEDPRVTCLFRGPHAYVSASLYARPERSVPTWNYVAAEVEGRARTVHDPARLEAMLAALARQHEPEGAWAFDRLETTVKDGLIGGIVGLEIDILALDGKAKLSQNRTAAERRSIANHLAASADSLAQATAAMMMVEE